MLLSPWGLCKPVDLGSRSLAVQKKGLLRRQVPLFAKAFVSVACAEFTANDDAKGCLPGCESGLEEISQPL